MKCPGGRRALGVGSPPRACIPARALQELPFQHVIKWLHKNLEGLITALINVKH